MKKTILLIGFLFTILSHSQEKLDYSQKDACMFSNHYYLYPATNTFEHEFRTDDAQTWYGYGTYTIKGGKIILEFEDSNEKRKPEEDVFINPDGTESRWSYPIHYESNFTRVLKYNGTTITSPDYYYTSKKKKVKFILQKKTL